MKAYEILLILAPTLSDDERGAAVKRIQDLITSNGGSLDTTEEWGRRKLAYEIDKVTEGDYVLFEFHIEPAAIAEIDRVLRISDAVVRFKVVRQDDKK